MNQINNFFILIFFLLLVIMNVNVFADIQTLGNIQGVPKVIELPTEKEDKKEDVEKEEASTLNSSASNASDNKVTEGATESTTESTTTSEIKNLNCSYDMYYRVRKDVADANMDALDHYEKYGEKEGMCKPDKATIESFKNVKTCSYKEYFNLKPELKKKHFDPLRHFYESGLKEGMCRPIDKGELDADVKTCTLEDYYKERPDVKKLDYDAKLHYLRHGKYEAMCKPVGGTDATTGSSTRGGENCTYEEYYALRPKVKELNIDALEHYDNYGKDENMCKPADNTCTYEEYYAKRDDVKQIGMDAMKHYDKYGINENMCKPSKGGNEDNTSSETCTYEEYYAKRPDVVGVDALHHYEQNGEKEGLCHPERSASKLSVTSVGSSQEDGFFVLKSFNQTLFGGAFGYHNKQKIFTYSSNRMMPVLPGVIVQESVCALEEFNGMLYANTESSGKIFRSRDGNNWKQVYKGKHTVGCGLAIFGDYLYAVNANFVSPAGYIYRSSNGTDWKKVYDSGSTTRYLREIVSYNNKLYAFYKTGVLISSDGTNWKSKSTPARMFRGHVYNGKLLLAGAREYSATKQSSIWSFDGENFKQLYSTPSMSHIGNIHSQGNKLLAITTVEWKGKVGGASLLQSCDGGNSWKKIHSFKETEGWAIEEYQGYMFVGTKQDGGGGQIYKVSGLCK